MRWLDSVPLPLLLVAAVALGLAPFRPEPHLWEKLRMMAAGELSRPLDFLDLVMHGAPLALLAAKLLRMAGEGRRRRKKDQ